MNTDEKAFIEEWSYVVMNMVASEEHLIESYTKTGDEYYIELADIQRTLRQIFIQTLWTEPNETLNILREVLSREDAILYSLIEKFIKQKKNLNLGSETQRTSQGELWCTIKHQLSIKMHIIECLQKKIREVGKNEEQKRK